MILYYTLGLIGIALIFIAIDSPLLYSVGLILIWVSIYNMLERLTNN